MLSGRTRGRPNGVAGGNLANLNEAPRAAGCSYAAISAEKRKSVKDIAKFFEQKANSVLKEAQREEDIRMRNQAMRKRHLEERLRTREPILSETERRNRISSRSSPGAFVPELCALPPPTPPRTTKEYIYNRAENVKLFADLEQYAVNLISENVTFHILMQQLFVWDLTELEKVRILFHWVSSQNLDEITFPPEVIEDSPYGHLKAIKENRSSYPTLFRRLCRAAGVHCKTIKGHVKCIDYYPDHKFSDNPRRFRTQWNAVLIDNQWRFIDTQWAARHVTGAKGEIVYEIEEHYFLTDPDKLITSHFPNKPAWQLLKQPKTLEQFENSVQCWPTFYDLKLRLASHYNGLIRADARGRVEITLRLRASERRPHFAAVLTEKVDDILWNEIRGAVTQRDTEDKEVFEVQLPKSGDFILTLHGGFDSSRLEILCRYQLVDKTVF